MRLRRDHAAHKRRNLGWSVSFASTLRCLATLMAAGPAASTAAQVEVVDGGCERCRIAIERVAVLDGGVAPTVDEPIALARMSDGRILLSTLAVPYQVAVFDSAGRSLGTVGRRGDGPGEYRFIRFISVTPEDSVQLIDVPQGRLSVLTPNLEFARPQRAAIDGATDLEILPDGRIVAAQDVASVQAAGFPLHLLGVDGSLQRSFGTDDPTYRRYPTDPRRRHVAWSSSRRAVWAAHRVRYRLELWDLSSRRILELNRNVPWFPTSTDYGIDYRNPGAPPNPGVISLNVDAEGRIWVPIHVADSLWHEGLGSTGGLYGGATAGIVSYERYYDTILEVIDPSRGEVVASVRFDEHLRLVRGTDYAFSYREDERGIPRIDVWHLRLELQRE